MAGGDAMKYETIKKLDVFEFWSVYDLWLAKVKRDTKNNQKNKANGRR